MSISHIKLYHHKAFILFLSSRERRFLWYDEYWNSTNLSGKNESIEIHIFDFNEDLYGKMITVCLYEKIRDERKFDSLEALKTQLIKDKKKCKRTLTVKGLI